LTTVFEERPLLVHGIKALGLLAAHLEALLGDDAQALLLEPGVDLAGQVPAGRIRLDDGERAFDGHKSLFRERAGLIDRGFEAGNPAC